MPSLTSQLSEAVVDLARRPLPDDVRAIARRSLTNVAGTAIGAAHADAVTIAVSALGDSAAAPCPVPGRVERLDAYSAALATGIAAHVDDFDDTHLRTVIHPAASGFATLLALASSGLLPEIDDDALLRAFALGCEVQLRLGNAVSPSHYDLGWHITGTCGVVGCAVTAALAWGLDADGVANAIGLACEATLGQREAFGTMTKAWHAGKAAQQGLLAAALARAGRETRDDGLDGPGGFFAVLSDAAHPGELIEGIGARWELLTNVFKPYPCGIVSHPVIDAALAAGAHLGSASDIARIDIACHPLVPELMGNMDPRDGLQGRFSAAHTAAAALADGELTLDQFADDRVRAEDLVRLRAMITFHPDPDVDRDEATVRLTLHDGRLITEHVEHARGSLARPLTDAELRAKIVRLVERVLPGHGPAVWAAGLAVDEPGGLYRLIGAMTPSTAGERVSA